MFLINKNLQPRIESSQNIDAISEKIFLFIIDCVLISRAGISHQQQQAAAWEWDQFFRTMKSLAWQMTRDTRLWVIRRNDLPVQSQDLPWPPGRGSLAWEESFCGCWTNCSRMRKFSYSPSSATRLAIVSDIYKTHIVCSQLLDLKCLSFQYLKLTFAIPQMSVTFTWIEMSLTFT